MFGFLSHIARIRLRSQDAEHIIFFLKKDIPWDELFTLAKNEGVAGLLYHHIDALKQRHALPGHILKELQKNYIDTSANTLQIVASIKALAPKMKQSDIEVIALQGLSVLRLYADPGLRPLGDADLLVRERDESRLKGLLEKEGYSRMSREFSGLYCSSRVILDVHTHILNLERIRTRRSLFPEDIRPMWKKTQPLFEPSSSVFLLDPYDNFIALAAHALKHGYSRLIWLSDMREWMDKYINISGSWQNLIERSKFWNQQRTVLYALLLLESVFEFELPGCVKSDLGYKKLSRFEKYILQLRSKGICFNSLCLVLWLFNIGGIKSKFRFIRETIFPRDEILEQIFFRNPEKRKGVRYKERIVHAFRLLLEDIRLILPFRW